jgi:hypothetical protein
MISKEEERQKAIALRKKGFSYTQIREQLTVSKSTLSLWLKDFPLSKSRIDSLRGKNPQRIERFRNTMRMKRESEESEVFSKIKKEIGRLSERERLIAGLFLYWGEGTKAAPCTTAVTNTDPDALKFFVHWLGLFDIKVDQLKVVLHLYKDMDAKKETEFWSTYLDIPLSRFRKPYIKNTRLCDITYKSGFGHGTCSVLYLGKDLYLYVKSSLKYIRMRA